MKKRLLMIAMTLILSSMVACGKKDNNTVNVEEKISSEKNTEDKENVEIKKEKKEEKVEDKKEELPNWRGIEDHFGYIVRGKGSIGIDISYPSLKPTSSGCAYQMDPALVLVTGPGRDENKEPILISELKAAFYETQSSINMYLKMYRPYNFTDFEFEVNAEEADNINGLSVYKYTGIHKYSVEGEAYEIPFVAYSVDTKQVENSYPTIIVMDDSINNPSMEPLPAGTIEAYARKMVESIKVDE